MRPAPMRSLVARSLVARSLVALMLAGMLGGCLSVPEGPTPECESTSDCDAASGEVCQEGVCWGNPPGGMFAAVVSPPSDQKDLVPKEITQLVMSEAGWVSGLQLERPVTLSGRLDADCTNLPSCDRSVAATITVTRGSQFQGGPGFKTVVTTEPSSLDGTSYEVNLPPTHDADPPYIVTIVPTGRGEEPGPTTTSGQIVPPLRMEVYVPGDMTKMITLGAPDLSEISGTLLTAGGAGLAQYRVVALGHWEVGSPPTEVSTVAYTASDGKFTLQLSKDLVETVEIVARPYGAAAPTLRLAGVPADSSSTQTLTQPPALGSVVRVTFPVRGKDGSGEVAPVRGASVRVQAQLAPTMGGTVATFVAEGTTNDAGEVELELLDGSSIQALYDLEVVPPASARVGVIERQPLSFGLTQAPLILPPRVAIRGTVVDYLGKPLKDVAVTARPSLRFSWSLDDAPQAFLNAIPAATTVTPDTGEFVLWVDPTVAGIWGHYDLVFDPPVAMPYPTRAPTWVVAEVPIPGMEALPAREVWLPDAAFVHGQVTDPSGNVVQGAEVKVFRVNTSLALCSMVTNAPRSCPIPAVLQGRGTSDVGGVVRVTLPR